MARVTLKTIATGYGSTDDLNENFTAIQAALETLLSRSGTTPNHMNAHLDMNGYSVINSTATGAVTDANFAFIGDWVTSTPYVRNNIVYVTVATDATYGGAAYICTTDHTSGAFSTDFVTNGYWNNLTAKGAGDLLSTNNLSDVANSDTSLSNLGGGATGIAIFKDTTPAAVRTEIDAFENVFTTRGDTLREGASGPERVALGSTQQALMSDGTDVVWAAARGYSPEGGIQVLSGGETAIEINVNANEDVYVLLHGIAASANDRPALQTFEAAAWVTGATAYASANIGNEAGIFVGGADGATSEVEFESSNLRMTPSSMNNEFGVEVRNAASATYTTVVKGYSMADDTAGNYRGGIFIGQRITPAAATKFRIFFLGGATFTAGSAYQVYRRPAATV